MHCTYICSGHYSEVHISLWYVELYEPCISNKKEPEGGIHAQMDSIYRVTLVVSDLGWVDLELGCSTILLGSR